jgi:hypothetical protein
MAERIQLFNDPGVLGKIGQVWFVESLGDGESQTGRHLRENLQDLLIAREMRVRIVLRRVANRSELFTVLDELCASVLATGLNPILDIECHGDDNRGLLLADQTFIPWGAMKSKLEAINLASRCNLVLVLGCCYGAYFGREARLYERAAFCAYIAPTDIIKVDVLEPGLHAFYAELFTSLDIGNAINAMRAASPEFGYVFMTAYGLFRKVFAEVIADYGMGEGLRQRAEAMALRLQFERGRIVGADEVAQVLKEGEPEAFAQFQRTYFALDLFPENEARFPLAYAQVKADADQLAKAIR